MTSVDCPYCGKEVGINHDDGYGYEEGEVYEQECEHCGKTFVYTTGILYVYHPEKAPCKNGEEHSWKDVQGYPSGYQSNWHICEWCNKKELKDETLKYDYKTDKWVKK